MRKIISCDFVIDFEVLTWRAITLQFKGNSSKTVAFSTLNPAFLKKLKLLFEAKAFDFWELDGTLTATIPYGPYEERDFIERLNVKYFPFGEKSPARTRIG